MTETSQLPESFEIEIDRGSLEKYYRRQWGQLTYALPCAFGSLIGMMFGIGTPDDRQLASTSEVVTSIIIGVGSGIVIGCLFASVMYFTFVRKNARKEAMSLQLFVEGPFLRIKQGTSSFQDRKLHFKSIIGYAFFQDSMMQACDLEGIRLTTQGGGRNSSVDIHGVKDAIRVRDMLCEIDRLREDA